MVVGGDVSDVVGIRKCDDDVDIVIPQHLSKPASVIVLAYDHNIVYGVTATTA